MIKAISIIVASVTFFVVIIAATKASVSGHIFLRIFYYYFISIGVVCFSSWLFMSNSHKYKYLPTFHLIFKSILIAILFALITLPVIDAFIEPSLVSNRSYGIVIWGIIFTLLYYGLWIVVSKRVKNSAI